MKIYKIYVLIALFSCSSMVLNAQKTRKAKTDKAVVAVETEAQKLYKTMLPSTAKIMFIDSVVVGKKDFLSYVPLNEEAGKLSLKKGKAAAVELGQYENNFGDRRIYALGDTTRSSLYTQTLLGDGWSQQKELEEISEEQYPFQNFPFLCSDGITMYFSAKGHNSIGGRDIFMTSFDTDKGEWYEPQNHGLPFNSKANDYLLAINDLDSIGWLVTDRHQPKDSVCIYTFVPTSSRIDFSADNLTNSELEGYAGIKRIKDTWKFGNRKAALQRRDAMLQRVKTAVAGNTDREAAFVVNDNTIVHSEAELKSNESKKMFGQLQALKARHKSAQTTLENKRDQYTSENALLGKEILQLEKECRQQQIEIIMLEKKIRQYELSEQQ